MNPHGLHAVDDFAHAPGEFARGELALAAEQQADPARPPRVLLINGSPRNDGSCPSEASKTWRLAEVARALSTDPARPSPA